MSDELDLKKLSPKKARITATIPQSEYDTLAERLALPGATDTSKIPRGMTSNLITILVRFYVYYPDIIPIAKEYLQNQNKDELEELLSNIK